MEFWKVIMMGNFYFVALIYCVLYWICYMKDNNNMVGIYKTKMDD